MSTIELHDVIDDAMDAFDELTESYGVIDAASICVGDDETYKKELVSFQPWRAEAEGLDNHIQNKKENGVCVTTYFNPIVMTIDGEEIIDGFTFNILIRYEGICHELLGLKLNKDDAMQYMRNHILHEIGHMLDFREIYVGKPFQQYVSQMRKEENDAKRFNWYRKNEMLGNKEAFQMYHRLPAEVRANNKVGLSWKELWWLE
jgi:hypothetical protein